MAEHIAADPSTRGQLRMHFLRNYNVSWAERVIPAADLSEQISLAGKEASGTGNMKFQMNGALTLGTLDGANIEIRQEVGPENFFLFGLDAADVRRVSTEGYNPSEHIAASKRLPVVLRMLEEGLFNPEERTLHRQIAMYLRHADPFLVCADFDSYCDAQEQAATAFADGSQWWRMVARNIGSSGKFSSDRTIDGYASEIWNIKPLEIAMPEQAHVVQERDLANTPLSQRRY